MLAVLNVYFVGSMQPVDGVKHQLTYWQYANNIYFVVSMKTLFVLLEVCRYFLFCCQYKDNVYFVGSMKTMFVGSMKTMFVLLEV